MIPKNLGDNMTIKALRPNAILNANEDSSAIDLLGLEGEILLVVDSTAKVTGTNPTLALKLTECDTSGGSYTDVSGGGLTAQTDTALAQSLSLEKSKLKRFVKLNAVIGGTSTPAYYVSANIFGMKKYQP